MQCGQCINLIQQILGAWLGIFFGWIYTRIFPYINTGSPPFRDLDLMEVYSFQPSGVCVLVREPGQVVVHCAGGEDAVDGVIDVANDFATCLRNGGNKRKGITI